MKIENIQMQKLIRQKYENQKPFGFNTKNTKIKNIQLQKLKGRNTKIRITKIWNKKNKPQSG